VFAHPYTLACLAKDTGFGLARPNHPITISGRDMEGHQYWGVLHRRSGLL